MWLITRKMMRRDLGMMVLAGIAIVIGTLFIALTFLFGNTMDASMRRMVTSDAAQANYAIVPKDDDQTDLKTVKDLRTKELAAVPGVRAVRSNTDFLVDVRAGKTKSEGGGGHSAGRPRHDAGQAGPGILAQGRRPGGPAGAGGRPAQALTR